MLFVELVDLLLPVVFDLLLHRDIADDLQLTLRVNMKLPGLFVLLLLLLHSVEHVLNMFAVRLSVLAARCASFIASVKGTP